MSEFDSRSSGDPGPLGDPDKAKRFDRAASVPCSHTSAAASGRGTASDWRAAEGSVRDAGSEAVRDVSLEALLFRLDEALAAIRSLDEGPGEDLEAEDVVAEDVVAEDVVGEDVVGGDRDAPSHDD